MAEFLLLGHIPGTSIYITFSNWLLAFSILVGSYLVWRLLFAKQQLWFGLIFVSLAIRRHPNRQSRPTAL